VRGGRVGSKCHPLCRLRAAGKYAERHPLYWHTTARLSAIGRILLASLSDRDLKSYFGKTSPLSMTPYTVTDAGKLKAEIETVKQVGYAMIDQELELGLFSVGVAIRDRAGRVVAGLSISSGTSWSKHHNFMQNVIGPLVDASHEITQGSPN
jgi:IclR family transcriptional regulator, pca regulon regulatory protein